MAYPSDKSAEKMSAFEKSLNSERELQNYKLKNSMLQEFADGLKKQLQDAEESLQKSRHEYYDVLQNRDSLKYEFDTVNDELKRVKGQKIELVELIDKKNDQIKMLKETVENVESLNSKKDDSNETNLFNEVKLREIKLEFEETRLAHERNLYNNQIKLLNEEVENKTNELLKCRKELNLNNLQSSLTIEQQSNEIKSLFLEISKLKSMNEALEKNNEEQSKKILDFQLNCTKLESAFNKESDGQNDIINLLVKRNEDLQIEIEKSNNDSKELRDIIQKGYEAHNELEMEFNKMKENYIKDMEESEEVKNKLTKELEQNKLLLSDMNKRSVENEFQKYFPVAHETNRQLNNMVNLSDLYDEFVRTKQELALTKDANTKLEDHIEELNEKIEKDKPIFYKNIQHYEQMADNYSQIQEELAQLVMEKEKFMAEKDIDTRMINQLKREIKRYEMTNNDLSNQIRCLLKSVHEANGFTVQYDTNYDDLSDGHINIPLELITFKNIQELQDKNRELIILLHRMSQELESLPSNQDSRTCESLQNDIENLKNEVEQLKKEIDDKNLQIERLTKQKRLINSPEGIELDSLEIIAENRELKIKIDKYSSEIDSLRSKNSDDIRKFENEKNSLIVEGANVKANLSKLTFELEAKDQHIKNIDLALEKYQTENMSLRERNITINANIENLERNVIALKAEIDSLKETVKMKDANIQMTISERDLFKNNENNLLRENSSLKQELENNKRMLYSLKALQENYNKVENESIHNLSLQIENLQRDNDCYKQKIERQEDKWKNSVNDFSARVHNLQILLDKEKNNCVELQKQNFDLQLKLQRQSDALVSRQAEIVEVDSSSLENNYKKQLQISQDEIKILKGKLSNVETTCQNLKTVNVSLEENLNKLIQNNEEIKVNLDSELCSKLETISKLNDDLNQLKAAYDKIVNEKEIEIDQLRKSIDESSEKIKQLKRLLEESNQATEKALSNERQVLDDLKIQTVFAAKVQEDYETEHSLRLDDAKNILELKLKVEELQKVSFEKDIEIRKAVDELNQSTVLFNDQHKSLEEDRDNLKRKCDSLEQINDSLITQIDLLNNQIIALQNNSTLFSLDENSQMQNATQLIGVIKFLREEKSQLQSQLSKINDEDLCLKIEIENYKKEIDNLKNTVQIEKESFNRLTNMNEFNELIAKAEMVQVLNENNSKMRNEINQLEKRCNDLMEKVTRYESNEKEMRELSNKTEDEIVEKQFLKNEAEQWKSKVNSLAHQLKNFDPESIRRIMVEKANLTKQVQTHLSEINKLRQELESKTRNLLTVETECNSLRQQLKQCTDDKNKLSSDLASAKNSVTSLQNMNLQLKTLARKYKAEIGKMKLNNNGGKVDALTETAEKEVQCEPVVQESVAVVESIQGDLQKLKELEVKLQEKIEQNEKLVNEVGRITSENESFKKLANDKEDVAKKIAQQAKQRLSEINIEKAILLRDKESLNKEIEELKLKILQFQHNAEQNTIYLNKVKSQYDSKISQQEKELQAANLQIESLSCKLQQPTYTQAQSSMQASSPVMMMNPSSGPIGTSSSVTSSSTSTPVRHSVLPQQQQPVSATTVTIHAVKTTPTASIKPLTMATPRSSSAVHQRPVTMVQPTATSEDNHPPTVVLPQATVQPTQTHMTTTSSMTVSSSIPFSTQNMEVPEVSTSQNLIQTDTTFLSVPSTSGLSGICGTSDKKRALDDLSTIASDEPSSSNSKKMKIGTDSTETKNDDSDIEFEQTESVDAGKDVESVVQFESQPDNIENYSDNELQEDSAPEDKADEEDEEAELNNEVADYEVAEVRLFDSEEEEEEEDDDVELEDDNADDYEDDDEESGEEDEEQDGDDEEDDDDEDSDSSEIEVIAIDSDSDDEAPQISGTNRDEVSSSHGSNLTQRNYQAASTDNQFRISEDLTTTTNDDGSDVAQSNQPNQQAGDTQHSEEDNPTTNQSNASEIASSTSSSIRFQRRQPVMWPQNNSQNNPNMQQQQQQQQQQSQVNARRLNLRGNRMIERRGNRRPGRGNRF